MTGFPFKVIQRPLKNQYSELQSSKVSLNSTLADNETVVYFLHQRKAAGSLLRTVLFDILADVLGEEKALQSSYVPCRTLACDNYDPDVRKFFTGEIKLYAGHISHHVPLARKQFGEKQVLITNFRRPLYRLESCLKFRHPDETRRIFGQDTFNKSDGLNLLFTPDGYGDTCLGESFRILSPYNPNEIISGYHVHRICKYVATNFHVLYVDEKPHGPLTGIEEELYERLSRLKTNVNTANFSATVSRNLALFLGETAPLTRVVEQEIELFECVHNATKSRIFE